MQKGQQYQRTDRAIAEAFIRICSKMEFSEITIQMIMEEALVSRNTFYAHYPDKYALAEKIYQEFYIDYREFYISVMDAYATRLHSMKEEKMYAEIKRLFRSFYTSRADRVECLKHIHTTEISLEAVYRKVHHELYASSKIYASNRDTKDLEADIFSAIQVAIIQNGESANQTFFGDPDGHADAIAYAALAAINIRDPKHIEEIVNLIRKYREES